MAIYYSILNNAFYDTEIGYATLPDDVIEITPEQHIELITNVNIHNHEIVLEKGRLVTRETTPVITWKQIRKKRNYILKKYDHTQLPDWPGDQDAWAAYRQELRDITKTFKTPDDVVWPTPPE